MGEMADWIFPMQRRKKTPDPLDLVPLLVLFVAVGIFLPGFRILLILAFAAGLILLLAIGFLRRKNADRERVRSLFHEVFGRTDSAVSVASEDHQWTLDLLRSLEWKRYEDVVAAYTKHLGLRSETTRVGADGGIDVHVYESGNPKPVMVVQCKAWDSYKVGVKPLRELYGVMAAAQINEGAFFTTSEFTQEALEFARGKNLDLVNGSEFLTRIKQLPAESQTGLLRFATEGDYRTPTCPSCGTKMVHRVAKKGAQAGGNFWGCRNYPRCKRTFQKSE